MKITKQNLKKIIIESIDSSINLKHAASFIYRSNEIEDYIEDIALYDLEQLLKSLTNDLNRLPACAYL